MAPVYGLAENAVAVTLPPPGRPPIVDRVDRTALNTHGIAEIARPDDSNAVELVACGQPIPGHEIRIIDEMGRELGERREGRLEFRGPSATSGYFQNAAKTRELFHDGWLDTGDRAYMAGGDLFITGRIKDIIIRAGQHIAPHEIEEAVGAIAGLRKNGVAAFGVTDPASGTERVVVLAETDENDPSAQAALKLRAQEIATHIVGGPPDEVVLVQPGAVPKTPSGKIRRAAARDLYLGKNLAAPQRALWWQLARLSFAGLGAAHVAMASKRRPSPLRRLVVDGDRRRLPAGWLAVMIAAAARLAMGCDPRDCAHRARGAQGSGLGERHRSHPARRRGAGVQSRELHGRRHRGRGAARRSPSMSPRRSSRAKRSPASLLRRLGVLFLERFDLADSLADLESVSAAARQGRLLVFFPEGTFTRRAGLSGFYLGAFRVAAQAKLPVVPAILRGTRSMLRGDQWFPRWSPIRVSIAEPIQRRVEPTLPRWCDCAIRVRAAILAGCGEPDLGELIKPSPPNAG